MTTFDPAVLDDRLLRSGTRSLLAAFTRPQPRRRQELEDHAAWYPLDVALSHLGLDADAQDDVTDRWLALLQHLATGLRTATARAELAAVVEALREVADLADRSPGQAKVEQVWRAASRRLAQDPSRVGVGEATLRGRHWPAIREELAECLAAAVADHARPAQVQHLLPRSAGPSDAFDAGSLRRLRERLEDQRDGGLLRITGPAGSGKTEFALAYIGRYLEQYDHVFWVHAADEVTLEQDVLAIGRTLVDGEQDAASLRRAVLDRLETTDHWLLVFDGVTDPALLLPYLPRNPWGHGICTVDAAGESGVADWEKYLDLSNFVEVPRLDATAVRGQLAARLQRDDGPGGLDDGDVRALTGAVAGSRLALKLAIGLLRDSGMSLADYLARFERERVVVPGTPAGAVAARLSLDHLAGAEGAEALGLLKRLVQYAPGRAIPAEALDHPVLTPADKLQDARVRRLHGLGLVDLNDHGSGPASIEIPPDVRTALERQAADTVATAREADDRYDRDLALHTILTRLFLVRDGRPTPLDFASLPHAEALVASDWQRRRHPVSLVELLSRISACHWHLGRTRAARGAVERILELLGGPADGVRELVRAMLFGQADEPWSADPFPSARTRHPPAPARTRLLEVVPFLRQAGNLDAAVTVTEELFRIADHEVAGPAGRSAQARLLFELALALRDVGRADHARKRVDEAIAIWTELADHRSLLAGRSLLAYLDFLDGDAAAAAAGQRAALQQWQRAPHQEDDDEHDVAVVPVELGRWHALTGRILHGTGDLAEARTHLERAVALWRETASTRGTLHLTTSRSRLALVKAEQGDLAEADEESQAALNAILAVHTRQHRDTAIVTVNRAEVLRSANRAAESHDLYRRAVPTVARLWGRRHPTYPQTLLGMARSAHALGRLDEAVAHVTASLRAWREMSGQRVVQGRGRCLVELADITLDHALTFPAGFGRPHDEHVLRLLAAADHLLGVAGDVSGSPVATQFQEVAVELSARQLRDPLLDRSLSAATTRVTTTADRAWVLRSRLLRVGGGGAGEDRPALARDMAAAATTPRDRLELVVAGVEAAGVERQQAEEDAMENLRGELGDPPHQLLARSYAVLADSVDRRGDARRSRRNQREADRTRPALDLDAVLRAARL